jgi:Spy/CpxP family protein refolding chaperone
MKTIKSLFANLRIGLAGCALLVIATAASAQVSRRLPMASFSLLQRPEVRKDLRLTSEQEQAIDAALAPLMREGPNGGKGIFITRSTDVGKVQEQVTRPLTNEQKKRLEQIELWVQGGRALLSPSLTKKLGLTANQTQAIDGIEQEFQNELTSKMDSSRRVMVRPEVARKYGDRMLKVLTPAQRKAFDTLRGKPFQSAVRI